jgi:L-lactate dehydrogenase complex protein LldF
MSAGNGEGLGHAMEITSHAFKDNAKAALADAQLQKALTGLVSGDSLVTRRAAAREKLPEFEALREIGRDIKNHTLAHLDLYLEAWEAKAKAAGANVHWAATAADARRIILDICQSVNARTVTKGKSMISEEVGLNAHLQAAGMEVVETDLGEYLVQIRKETPSHIIAPAIHLTQDQVEKDFRQHHSHLPKNRVLVEAHELVNEARQILRDKFIQADVGITGANFLIAETGSSVIVTNEGNGDLTQSLAKVHVVIASIEKVVPTLADVSTILRLLARSATGQEISTYTTFSTGPRRPGDPDGPEQYHVVLLDNGRTALLGTPFQEALRCIRCAACMNHCPVYGAVGGHAYGWVYPGPIGAVINPALIGLKEAASLPNASTFCGRCAAVCPMKIPLPDLMREWRTQEFEQRYTSAATRFGLKLWGYLARRPQLYHLAMRVGVAALGAMGRRRGAFRSLPLAGGWTRHRDMPAPQGRTFQQLWAEAKAGVPK